MSISKQKLFFIGLFSFLGFLTLQVPFSEILGLEENQSFTLFEFFAPITGMFIGGIPGALSVLFVKGVDTFVIKQSFDLVSFLRLFTLPLAAFYFGSSSNLRALIPLICFCLFNVHPIGSQAWEYSLFWFIPAIAAFFPSRLFLRSLGSTFTAHALGAVIFLYAFELPAELWLSIIPVVFVERILFATGIFVSFLTLNFGMRQIVNRFNVNKLAFLVKEEYLPSWKFVKERS